MANMNEIIQTNPINVEKTVRSEDIRALTSAKPGQIIPLAYAPLLREDRIRDGRFRIRLEMAETVKTLLNAINVTVHAHFVPYYAFGRWNGLDQFNRSYEGIPEGPSLPAIPFFTTATWNGVGSGVYRTLGVHHKDGTAFNTAIVEAYNAIVNFRRKARSSKIPLRDMFDGSLAEAFWRNPSFEDVVPDFEQALIDGEVELRWATDKLPVRGINAFGAPPTTAVAANLAKAGNGGFQLDKNGAGINFDIGATYNKIYTELSDSGIKLSLANIDLARQTAAFAELRSKFSGVGDDYIIDLLMDGIRVPDALLSQPMLIGKAQTVVGYSRRYATDAANLDTSVTTGETFLDLSFKTPPMNTGGVLMITMEIVPEQMFERQDDRWISMTDASRFPRFLKDYLDPEKVDIVRNKDVDVRHATPDAVFGYRGLNSEWNRSIPRIGGKFIRPADDAWNEDRMRIWSSDMINPTLTENFYLVKGLKQAVFADTVSDPFEITTIGGMEIVGNTVFGKQLHEDDHDYEDIMAKVDTSRIVQ